MTPAAGDTTPTPVLHQFTQEQSFMFEKISQSLSNWLVQRTPSAGWLRTRYTRALEDEVARLRAQNRALINSILGVAGIPPMRVARHVAAPTQLLKRSEIGTSEGVGTDLRRPSISGTGEEDAQPAALRRRSWQQIGRALEIEDARAAQRERETDTATFPTPRSVIPRV